MPILNAELQRYGTGDLEMGASIRSFISREVESLGDFAPHRYLPRGEAWLSFQVLRKLEWTDQHQRRVEQWRAPHEGEARSYSLPLSESFQAAKQAYPSVSVDAEVMAGAPCIRGTRIPVYMILDAIEYYGSTEGAVQSYPHLTIEQIKQAVGFAKLVVECPLDDEA